MTQKQKLSVVMPVFNERTTIEEIIERVTSVEIDVEMERIIVDDGSTDGTRELLSAVDDPRVHVILQPENGGKGSALRTGFEALGCILKYNLIDR